MFLSINMNLNFLTLAKMKTDNVYWIAIVYKEKEGKNKYFRIVCINRVKGTGMKFSDGEGIDLSIINIWTNDRC